MARFAFEAVNVWGSAARCSCAAKRPVPGPRVDRPQPRLVCIERGAMRAMASQRAVSALAGVAVLLALATPTSSAVPALPIPPNMDGPNNGGHFIFGTVSWTKLQHDPPMIEFTVEAAFRRSYSSTNFQGSGDDGPLGQPAVDGRDEGGKGCGPLNAAIALRCCGVDAAPEEGGEQP